MAAIWILAVWKICFAVKELAMSAIEGRVPMVLVADDDPLVRHYITALLRQLGCAGVAVENGQQALECLSQRAFALVLLDVSMPVLDGVAALARIRARKADVGARRQPIAMVTAHAEPGDVARLRAAGADGHIAKPIEAAQFCAEVRRCLAL
jgi:CheY-like chemotaxis protein